MKGNVDFPNRRTSRSSVKYVKKIQPLTDQMNPDEPISRAFFSLIHSMLVYDPKERLTARDALSHPYITGKFALIN